jgi:hypothetical protein
MERTSASSVGMMMRRRGYQDTGSRGQNARAWILPD